jgi:VCBS repeat-containing protein
VTTGSGDDTISAGGGNNTIVAGEGRNNVNTGSGNDTITTGSGDDTINTGDGVNLISAGDGRNTVNTGSGNDVITAGSGDDTINAGDGVNLISASDGRNTVNAGNGNDTITTGSGDDTINAGDGANIIVAGDGRNTVNTGSGNDVITAGSGDDTINAGGGNNIIDAGDGRNTVNTGSGNDVITAGDGDNTINAGEGNNVIDAGNGRNTVNTGSGRDTITSGNGNDTINSGAGDDTVTAGGGQNQVNLGSGNDTVIHSVSDVGFSRYNGDSGSDTLKIVLTEQLAQNADVLNELTRLAAAAKCGAIGYFKSDILKLEINNFENVQIVAPVAARDDTAATSENSSVSIAVLANDVDLLGSSDNLRVSGISLASGPAGVDPAALTSALTINPNGKAVTFNPGGLFDYLAAGQTTTATFRYTVIDNQGFEDTAQVTITISGTNDGATISGSTTGAVIEDAASSTSGTLIATDADTGQARFQAPAMLDGAYGSFAFNATTGEWAYTLDARAQKLTAGAAVNETLTVTSHDGTATKTIVVNVTGTNDVATIAGNASGNVTEDAAASTSGTLGITDVDTGEARFQTPASLSGTYGSFGFNAANGEWTYALDNRAEALINGETRFEYLTVKSLDGTATRQIQVTVTGTNDAATISGDTTGAVTEDGTTSTAGTLTVQDVDRGENHFRTPATLAGNYGSFTFNMTTGEWTYALDHRAQALSGGQLVAETLKVTSLDGTTKDIAVDVTGTNDTATISQTEYDVYEGTAVPTEVGRVYDADAGESGFRMPSSLVGSYGSFAFTADGGLTYQADARAQSLAEGMIASETLQLTSIDGTAQRFFHVTVKGVNDVATISGDTTGAVTEDTAPTTSGCLTVHDADLYQNNFQVPNARAQALTGGQIVNETIIVTSTDGTASETIVVEVKGTNDVPFIDALPSYALTEETAGTVELAKVFDSDAGESGFRMPASLGGAYGNFGFNAAGALTYTVDSRAQALAEGEVGHDIINVTSIDGTESRQIVVAVYGQNDAATILPSGGGFVTEDSAPTTSGRFMIWDADHGQDRFQMPATLHGTYGNFTFDTDTGAWTYALDERAQALRGYSAHVETLTVTSLDGTASQTIYVTAMGTNDIPTIAGTATGAVTEDGVTQTSGQLTISDIDSDDNSFRTPNTLAGAYGNFTFDAATGAWSYALDQTKANVLAQNQHVQDRLTVTSFDGSVDQDIVVDVTGANDSPVVAASAATSYTALAGSRNTAGAFSLDLNSLIKDVDATDTLQFTTSTLPAGFTLGTDGIIRQTDPRSLDGTGIHSLHVTANDGHGGVVSRDIALYVAESFGDNFSSQATTSVARPDGVSVLNFGLRAAYIFANVNVTTGSGGDWLHFGDQAGGIYSQLNVNAGDGDNTVVFGDMAGYGNSTTSVTTGAGNDYVGTGSMPGRSVGVFSASTGAGNDTIKIGDLSAQEGTVTINAGSGADNISFGVKAGTGDLASFNPSRGGTVTVDLGANDHAADVLIFAGPVKATVTSFEVGIDDLDLSTSALTLTESGNDVHLTSNAWQIDIWLMGVGTGHSVGEFLL